MGHYDSAYEYDAKKERQARYKRLKTLHDEMSLLGPEVRGCLPIRFIDAHEDALNYLQVQLKKLE